MTPINAGSFWSQVLRPYVGSDVPVSAKNLIAATDKVYETWKTLFHGRLEIPVSYERPYFIDEGVLTKNAGLVQIKDYAQENDIPELRSALKTLQEHLKKAKNDFFETVTADLHYFGSGAHRSTELTLPDKTTFEKTICRRVAVAGLLVEKLHADVNFGRTKFAKLFYLANMREELDLQTDYSREAAGPLDQRAFYNARYGIEAIAQKYSLFSSKDYKRMVRYEPAQNLDKIDQFAATYLGSKVDNVRQIAEICRHLSTDQSEIVATLFACWNDFLIQKRSPTDEEIITEFLLRWHAKKSRFSRQRLSKALAWMRRSNLVPRGWGKLTSDKPIHQSTHI